MALRTLITGAAGNLGSLLSRHLAARSCELRLMYHRTPLPPDMLAAPNVQAVSADLADPTTIMPAVEGADVVVHFAGRLFAPRPETFLPETNTRWFANLVTAAIDARVGRVILASFPQVEGPTSVERPRNRPAHAHPISVHAQTRLEEERLLFERTECSQTTPVVLRFGLIYGRGILMVEAARWLIRAAAASCEVGASVAGTPSPLTRDFVRLGRVPHWGDTRRARAELIPQLSYPTLDSGLSTL
jgi:nucleoside-diphosphate-sugar epimerase